MRALTHAATAPAATTVAAAPARLATGAGRPLFGDAAAALALLGDAPLRPTGPVADALAAGTLLRSRGDDALDHLERVLREGAIDMDTKEFVGEGVNGMLWRRQIADPVDTAAARIWAVEKPAGAQAAQEELGWRLGRALGIDHLLPAVARRADGTARIEFRSGKAVTLQGITDIPNLEQALARAYLDDATLGLTHAEAAQAARIDRQLLQVFDYLLANNDRRAANALFDAAAGMSFIDAGHAGRGALATNGGTTLEPALQLFQAGREGGRVDIDPVVLDFVRRRLTADDVRSIHSSVFDAPGIAGPAPHTLGEKFLGHVRSERYREGVVERLDHLLEHGGYTHRRYAGDAGGELPPLMSERMHGVTGFKNIRAAMHGGMF